MKIIRAVFCMNLMTVAVSSLAGDAVFYINENGKALANMELVLDGKKKVVQDNGFTKFDLQPGNHKVEILQLDEMQTAFEFDVKDGQFAEIQVDLANDVIKPVINITTPDASVPVVGKLLGHVQSLETGEGISNVNITIPGSTYTATTDENGNFELQMPVGDYGLSFSHKKYVSTTSAGVHVFSSGPVTFKVEMNLPSNSTVDELVLEGDAVIESSTARTRDAKTVIDTISTEEIARAGDSTAAAAVKRVTGVTIADGKYAIVRGLNERYTAILYNGANIPSPDPSRRVVPLDIFPTGVVDNIDIQKSGSADYPADSAGATINIISSPVIEEFEGKLNVSLGVNDITGNHERVQKTSGMEILGFGSSDRDLSSRAKAFAKQQTPYATGAVAGNLLDLSQLETEKTHVDPDQSVELSIGDLIGEFDAGALSYKFTGKYSNEWDLEKSKRAAYSAVGNGTFEENDEYIQRRVTNDINLGSGFSLNFDGENYKLHSNTLLLRQTQSDNIGTKGIRGEYRSFTDTRSFAWRERAFTMEQILGEYLLENRFTTLFSGGLTFANASLDAPDMRSYSFIGDSAGGIDNIFNPLAQDLTATTDLSMGNKPTREYTKLSDDSLDINAKADTTLIENDDYTVSLLSGYTNFSRKRDSQSFQYIYGSTVGGLPAEFENNQNISSILNMQNFNAGIFDLTSITNFQGSYEGNWDFQSLFLQPTLESPDLYKISLGFRQEDSSLKIITDVDPASKKRIRANVDDNDLYPSLNASWFVIEELQLRFSYFESINRPDFREVAPAQFVDPVSGDLYQGNPKLLASTIDNMDIRAEYYFSESESVSVGLFRKDFKDAIERTTSIVAGSSSDLLYSYDNADKAIAEGLEITAGTSFETDKLGFGLSGNAAFFDTEVALTNASGKTGKKRNMQGQPEMLTNFQFLINEFESGREYTLVTNYTGRSLDSVSYIDNISNFFRDSRTIVDANFKQPIITDVFDIKFSIKNLLDSTVMIRQEGKMVREYNPGPEYKFSATYNF